MSGIPEGAKVLLVGPNWLGDMVMAEPALRAAAAARPDLSFSWLAPASLAPLLRGHPALSEVIAWDRRGEHRGFFGRGRLRASLRERGFAAVVLLRNSLGAAWDAWRTGIPVRIGFSFFPRSLLLTEALPLPPGFRSRHRTGSYLDLVRTLGVAPDATAGPPRLAAPEAEKAKVPGLLAAAVEGGGDADLTRPLVGIHPGASYGPSKLWGVERFAGFADRWIEDHGATVVILGGPDEVELGRSIVAGMRTASDHPAKVRNLVGSTPDIATLAAVMSDLDLFLGNDSGPSHLAAALGIPTVAVYGSTSTDFTGVRGAKVAPLWEHLDCSPCFKRECPREDYMACMDAIPVARAYTSACELLGIRERAFEEIRPAVGDTPTMPDRGD